MKQLTIVVLLSIAGYLSYGQNKNIDAKYAVKLYNLSSWQKQGQSYFQGIYTGVTTQKKFQPFHPTVAFRIKNARNNFHEIELTEFEVGSEDFLSTINQAGIIIPMAGGKTSTSTIAVRYEYTLNFNKRKSSKLMPAIGLALMPYYQRTSFTPALAMEFPATRTQIGAKGFVIPRLNYVINSRLFLDVNIPFCVTDMYAEMKNAKNPALTQQEQKNDTGNFDGIPQFYSFRVGVGLNI
jgi:hypothetical protein